MSLLVATATIVIALASDADSAEDPLNCYHVVYRYAMPGTDDFVVDYIHLTIRRHFYTPQLHQPGSPLLNPIYEEIARKHLGPEVEVEVKKLDRRRRHGVMHVQILGLLTGGYLTHLNPDLSSEAAFERSRIEPDSETRFLEMLGEVSDARIVVQVNAIEGDPRASVFSEWHGEIEDGPLWPWIKERISLFSDGYRPYAIFRGLNEELISRTTIGQNYQYVRTLHLK